MLLGDRRLAERFEEMGEIEVARRVIPMSERLTRDENGQEPATTEALPEAGQLPVGDAMQIE